MPTTLSVAVSSFFHFRYQIRECARLYVFMCMYIFTWVLLKCRVNIAIYALKSDHPVLNLILFHFISTDLIFNRFKISFHCIQALIKPYDIRISFYLALICFVRF